MQVFWIGFPTSEQFMTGSPVQGMMPEWNNVATCPLCGQVPSKNVDTIARLRKCCNCGLVYDSPRPSLDALAHYYSLQGKFDGWLANRFEREQLWNRRLAKLLPGAKRGVFLDIGAGIGQLGSLARRHYPTVLGTELSASAVQIAKEQFQLDLFHGTVNEFALTCGPVDTITMFHVLEHVHDPGTILAVCYDLLTDGGTLVIAVPNELRSLRKRFRGLIKQIVGWAGHKRFANVGRYGLPRLALDSTQDEIHLSHFVPGVLANGLKRCGFEILENGLDPYFVSKGAFLVFETVWYRFCSALRRLTGVNIYETIWIVARKVPRTQDGV